MENSASVEAARELLNEARDEPRAAITKGRQTLGLAASDDHSTRAIILRALSLASRVAGTIEESVWYGEEAVREADLAGSASLRSEALMTLAGSVALRGQNLMALELLAKAYEGSSGGPRPPSRPKKERFDIGWVKDEPLWNVMPAPFLSLGPWAICPQLL